MFKQPTTALIIPLDEFGNPLPEIQASYCIIAEYQEYEVGKATVRYSFFDSNDNNLKNDMWFTTTVLSNIALLFRRAVAGTITEAQKNVLDENLFLSPEGLSSIPR